jgi:hypothetical protein
MITSKQPASVEQLSRRNHLSTSMACVALAFAKAESFVFTFFLPTLKLPAPFFFLSLPSI